LPESQWGGGLSWPRGSERTGVLASEKSISGRLAGRVVRV